MVAGDRRGGGRPARTGGPPRPVRHPAGRGRQDWLQFLGISYHVAPNIGIPVSTTSFGLRVVDEELELTCQIFNETGERVQDLVVENPKRPWGGDAVGVPLTLDRFPGTSLTLPGSTTATA